MSPVEVGIIRRKLAAIVENLKALEPIARMTQRQYLDDLYKRKATERLLQELIEAAIDINTYIIVQTGQTVPDDYYESFIKAGAFKSFHQTSRRNWLHPRAFGIDLCTNITCLSIQWFWMPSGKLKNSTRST